MKLSDLSVFSVKRKVRNAIWKSQDAIDRIEADILQFKNRLAECENDPRAEQWAVDRLRGYVAAMEENLAEFKVNHARYVAEQRQPSAAFPRGVSV